MKIDKEYPATHSMSTAWFAVDKDGNVAIMDYDDNGPVPIGVPETDEGEIICGDFAHKNLDEPFYRWMFSDEEMDRIMKNSEDYELKEDDHSLYRAIVRVDMSRFDEFLQDAAAFPKYDTICINMEKGLFYLDCRYTKKGNDLKTSSGSSSQWSKLSILRGVMIPDVMTCFTAFSSLLS